MSFGSSKAPAHSVYTQNIQRSRSVDTPTFLKYQCLNATARRQCSHVTIEFLEERPIHFKEPFDRQIESFESLSLDSQTLPSETIV